jgi:DNA-binding XRE family transcriptional regulator
MEQLIPLDIGQELKKLRVMQKFEQSDVGLYIGVSDRTVRNIEKGAIGTKTATVLLAVNNLDCCCLKYLR